MGKPEASAATGADRRILDRDIPASPRQPAVAGVRVYPDLLSNARVARSDPVRAADITYLTMTSGVPA